MLDRPYSMLRLGGWGVRAALRIATLGRRYQDKRHETITNENGLARLAVNIRLMVIITMLFRFKNECR